MEFGLRLGQLPKIYTLKPKPIPPEQQRTIDNILAQFPNGNRGIEIGGRRVSFDEANRVVLETLSDLYRNGYYIADAWSEYKRCRITL